MLKILVLTTWSCFQVADAEHINGNIGNRNVTIWCGIVSAIATLIYAYFY
jgi:hypothetical protein